MGNSAYSAAAPIISSILAALKRVASKHGMLSWRRSEIYNVFLRTTILSSIVRCVVSAEREQCSAG